MSTHHHIIACTPTASAKWVGLRVLDVVVVTRRERTCATEEIR